MAYAYVTGATPVGGVNGGTTSAIDTTGANLIVLSVIWYHPGGTPTVSDSKGNTYTALTHITAVSGSSRLNLYYCYAPTVGTGHTFTIAGSGIYAGVGAAAFSGAASSPLDAQTGATAAATTVQPGSITPSVADALLISAAGFDSSGTISVNGGFTEVSELAFSGGVNFGVQLAYLIQTSAAAANPTSTTTVSANLTAKLAAFQAAAGGGYTLTADAGAYTLSGQDATLLKTRIVTADAGSYAVGGQDASVLVGHKLTADAGAYSVAGQDATLTYVPVTPGAYTLTCDAGAYVLAGQDATLLRGRVVAADAGSYAVSGSDAQLTYSGAQSSAAGGYGKQKKKVLKDIKRLNELILRRETEPIITVQPYDETDDEEALMLFM